MTRYEYLMNELHHATKLAKTLPDESDRQVFSTHASKLAVRIGNMTPAEGSVEMFEEVE